MNAPKKYLIVCLSTCTFYASTYSMEEEYNFSPQQPYNRHTMLRRVCTYTIIPITILASTATVSILAYKWLNPVVDQAEEDTQKISTIIDQASLLLPQAQQFVSQSNNLLQLINPMVPRVDQFLNQANKFLNQAENLYPQTQQLLTQGNNLLQQLNTMVPHADKLLCDAENLYPQIELALSSFLNITERLGQLFG